MANSNKEFDATKMEENKWNFDDERYGMIL
jgi:hypothetical protein